MHGQGESLNRIQSLLVLLAYRERESQTKESAVANNSSEEISRQLPLLENKQNPETMLHKRKLAIFTRHNNKQNHNQQPPPSYSQFRAFTNPALRLHRDIKLYQHHHIKTADLNTTALAAPTGCKGMTWTDGQKRRETAGGEQPVFTSRAL